MEVMHVKTTAAFAVVQVLDLILMNVIVWVVNTIVKEFVVEQL